jgi:hypothetical protein
MKRIALVLSCLVALAVPAAGQGWSMTAWFQQTIALQASRLDLIKSAQDLAAIDPNMRGYIDQAWQWQDASTNATYLHLEGWGFECGQSDLHAVDVRLNGYMVDGTTLVRRYPRSDVVSHMGLSSWCPSGIPLYGGVVMDVPLGQLLPGWYYVRLRLWNRDGHSIESNTIPVVVS